MNQMVLGIGGIINMCFLSATKTDTIGDLIIKSIPGVKCSMWPIPGTVIGVLRTAIGIYLLLYVTCIFASEYIRSRRENKRDIPFMVRLGLVPWEAFFRTFDRMREIPKGCSRTMALFRTLRFMGGLVYMLPIGGLFLIAGSVFSAFSGNKKRKYKKI